MDRRQAIRLLATAAGIPFLTADLFAELRVARAALSPSGPLHTLNDAQNTTVVTMAEIILPKTDTPGATEARVSEFIDLILTEWYSEEDRARFLRGLAMVDAEANKAFGKAFNDCNGEQQTAIVKQFDQEMVASASPTENVHAAHEDATEQGQFFHMMKQLTLTGYFTSEAGAKQALHFQMIPGHYQGCVPIAPADRR